MFFEEFKLICKTEKKTTCLKLNYNFRKTFFIKLKKLEKLKNMFTKIKIKL